MVFVDFENENGNCSVSGIVEVVCSFPVVGAVDIV